MKIIEPSIEIIAMPPAEKVYRILELAGRTCYKSDNMITADSAEKFVAKIVRSRHESVIEHVSATVRIICDRGISHEIVRHRLCSFSQESTRYANYSKEKFGKEITVIRPCFWEVGTQKFQNWRYAMQQCEVFYMDMLATGATAQEARSALPNSLKTEIICTANFREWMHIFNLRCHPANHPQMVQVMTMVREAFADRLPVLFTNRSSWETDTRKTPRRWLHNRN